MDDMIRPWDPDVVVSTAELAELLDMKRGPVDSYLARQDSWGQFLESSGPIGSGYKRRIGPRDVVICAALRDVSGAVATDLRHRLVSAIRCVPWGTRSVTVEHGDNVQLRYEPRWSLIDLVLPAMRHAHSVAS